MSGAKHTSGPWTLETVKTSSGICHKIGPFPWRPERQNHACIYHDYPNGTLGPVELELRANALLIAAAPDLYQATVNMLGLARLKFGNLDPAANVLFDHAEATLAKARGEQSA